MSVNGEPNNQNQRWSKTKIAIIGGKKYQRNECDYFETEPE